jgi:hypothetical protein
MILRFLKAILRFLKAITYPFRRLYDLVHNGQEDIEGVYPEAFHPTGEEAVRQGAVISGFMAGLNGGR